MELYQGVQLVAMMRQISIFFVLRSLLSPPGTNLYGFSVSYMARFLDARKIKCTGSIYWQAQSVDSYCYSIHSNGSVDCTSAQPTNMYVYCPHGEGVSPCSYKLAPLPRLDPRCPTPRCPARCQQNDPVL